MPTKILIADDEPDTLELLVLGLRGTDLEVTTVVDGFELLDQIAEFGPFDVIVTDVNMPKMRGLQALASVRTAGLDTPAIIVTGRDDLEVQAIVAGLGHAMLLRKPFGIAELRAAIAMLVVVPR